MIAALAGDRIFATATPIIAAVNTFFLSPLLMSMISRASDQGVFYLLAAIFLAAPFVAMALYTKGILRIGVPDSA